VSDLGASTTMWGLLPADDAVRPNGKDLTQLTHYKQGTLVLSTSYSPDGKWIVHATNGVQGNVDVF
jgi:TolB protein